MLSRLVLAAFLLGSLVLFQYRYHIYHFPPVTLVYIAVVVLFLSALYWYLFKSIRSLRLLAYLQICGDILLISWLVSLTGVIDSSFSLLYHAVIIAASIILYRRGGYLAASCSSILYGSMLDMQYYNILGFSRSQNFTAFQVLYLLFVNILSFYLVAFLSGYLSERLRKTRQELQEKSMDFEDLRVLQDQILRSVGSGIVTMDMTGKVTSWNNAAELITGYTFEEVRDDWKSIFGESIKGLFGHTDDLKERPVRFEGRIRKQDGAKTTLGFTASLLKDDLDTVRGIILTFQDITRLIEMEDQIRRQERLASVGSLAAGIAHEIRNPLASLSGSIQMLQSELALKDDHKHLMDIVLRETDRLNMIITEFLEYARPRPSSREHISFQTLLDDTVVLFKNSKNYRTGIEIRCVVDPRTSVAADPQRLRQVFWNLLINASQAIREDGVISISVSPGKGEHSDKAIVEFEDTGSGIADEHLQNIFDPFFTTKSDGTGLGLAIVYRIIDDLGGSVDVKTEIGTGTVFTITLPLSDIPAKDPLRQEGRMPASADVRTK